MNSKESENGNLFPLRSRDHFKSHIVPYSIGALGAVGSLTDILDIVPDQVPKMWFWLAVWVISILLPLLVGAYRNSSYSSTFESVPRKVLVEREILRSGILILQRDHLTDQEISALNTMSSGMDNYVSVLSTEDRRKIVRSAFDIACADKNFRMREQNALTEIIRRYSLQHDREVKEEFDICVAENPGTYI
jgi:hypothetical protein